MDMTADDEIRQIFVGKPHVVILGAGASYAAFPLPPLRHPAAGRESRSVAASGDRDPADHAAGDRASVASPGLPLLLHQHLRRVAGGCGANRYGPRLSALVGLLGSAQGQLEVSLRGLGQGRE